jgi:hypothetical protein
LEKKPKEAKTLKRRTATTERGKSTPGKGSM